jgi:hypothetical protein
MFSINVLLERGTKLYNDETNEQSKSMDDADLLRL